MKGRLICLKSLEMSLDEGVQSVLLVGPEGVACVRPRQTDWNPGAGHS